MKLAILSTTLAEEDFLPCLVSFRDQAGERGHDCRLVRHGDLGLALGGSLGEVLWGPGAAALAEADLVIPRLNQRYLTRSDFYVLDHLAHQGVDFLNRIPAIEAARNKITTLQMLQLRGIPVPATVLVRRPEHLAAAARIVGPGPFVVKPTMGSQGRDVVRVDGLEDLERYFDQRWAIDRHEILLVQEFLSSGEAPCADLRVLVLLGQVVGGMRREAVPGEFRTNFSLGARVFRCPADPATEALALRAADALDLDLAGVDIMITPGGPKVLEVNANPGWEGISTAMAAAGEDFYERMLDILEQWA